MNPISLFIFFSTLLIYNYRKLFFSYIELIPQETQRAQWLRSNRFLLGIITLSSVFGIFISVFSLSFKTLVLVLPLFLVSVLYATPFSKNKNSPKRLRHLPFLKLFLVAGVWTMVTVLLPEFEVNAAQLESKSTVFTCLTRFLFIFAITLPFDIRDMEVDRKNNIKTFPVILGVEKTIRLAVAILLLFIVAYVYSQFAGDKTNAYKAAAYILSGLISIAFILQVPKQKSEYFVSVGIEGLMLIQFLLLFLFHHFIA